MGEGQVLKSVPLRRMISFPDFSSTAKEGALLKSALSNFEDFLKTSDFEISLQKYKSTKTWHHKTEEFNLITIEISYVEFLGYFIEIEILSEKNDDETVTKAQKELHQTLQKCGINKDRIETRYYWQLLKGEV